jgi:hypothetical protein
MTPTALNSGDCICVGYYKTLACFSLSRPRLVLSLRMAGSSLSKETARLGYKTMVCPARLGYKTMVCPALEYLLTVPQFTQQQCVSDFPLVHVTNGV